MYLLALAESIQLFPDGTIFIHIGLILTMIWVLNRTLFRPINKVIDEREKAKGGAGGAAEKILGEVGEKEASYNAAMLDTRSKGYELIEKEQKKAVEAREKKLSEVKTEIAQTFDSGKTELEKQTAEARASIGANAEQMADKIAASILRT
jgi:F0F1-type ATP synthase membrane subunit b/b'